MKDYTIKVIPGKYLLIIDGELTTFNSPYDVARAIIVDFHKTEYNDDPSSCIDREEVCMTEMAGNLAQDKLVMLPQGTWKITYKELLEWFG